MSMTVKELKDRLRDFPDDMTVYVPVMRGRDENEEQADPLIAVSYAYLAEPTGGGPLLVLEESEAPKHDDQTHGVVLEH
jgi:hypothetical protein